MTFIEHHPEIARLFFAEPAWSLPVKVTELSTEHSMDSGYRMTLNFKTDSRDIASIHYTLEKNIIEGARRVFDIVVEGPDIFKVNVRGRLPSFLRWLFGRWF